MVVEDARPVSVLLAPVALCALFVLFGCGNRPPSDPVLSGPDAGQPGETLYFRARAVDPDGDDIAYRFDWGEAGPSDWSAFARSGDSFFRRHRYDSAGLYEVRAQARDRRGLESGWSVGFPVRVALAGPYLLGPPTGPELLYPDSTGEFFANAGHVREDSVSVQFDWNGTSREWSAWVRAGEAVRDTFQFRMVGEYQVRFRARDRAGAMSLWSEPLAVTVVLRPLEPPGQVRLSTQDGVELLLQWDTGRNPETVRYGLWFRPAGEPDFRLEQLVLSGSARHAPGGMVGCYTVSARLEDEELFAADTLTTRPVYSEGLVLYELNTGRLSGYGWDDRGQARLLAMSDTASAGAADLYFTDRSPGSSGPAFFLSSPHLGPDDPGGGIPDGPWRRTGLARLWGPPWEPLPPYDSLFYTDLVDVTLVDTWLAAYDADGRYALLHSLDPEPESARVRVRSWYQLVPGLRLISYDGSFPGPR